MTFEEIVKCFKENKKINWHKDYLKDPWSDHPGPLTITDAHHCVDRNCCFIQYLCSDPNCRRCTDKTLLVIGHHKWIKLNGNDLYGKVEFTETKKQTLYKILDCQVFSE